MSKIIVNADDFGYCEGVNYGIISAYQNGIVSSTTIMANMPGFDHGVKLLKENPGLGTGVHLTLTCYKPILKTHKTLVNEDGFFNKRSTKEVIEKVDLEELYNEFSAQIQRVLNSGIKISHLDSHHHVHSIPKFKPVIEKLLEEYKVPVRGHYSKDAKEFLKYFKEEINEVPLIGNFYDTTVSLDWFKNNIDEFKKHKVSDIMTHPAFLDSYLKNSTSYADARIKEHEILTSREIIDLLKMENIELTNYNSL